MPSLCILIVEDEPTIALLEKKAVEGFGHTVEIAKNGAAAIAMLKADAFDMVLLDYQLPDMSGVEILAEIIDRFPAMPVIMITGHGDERLAADTIKAGAKDYIVKDYESNFLKTLPKIIPRIYEKCLRDVGLKESEKKYQTLVDVFPVGIFQTDTDGNCVYVNQKWCAVVGVSMTEALGQGWVNAIHPDDRPRVVDAWYKSAKEKTLFRSEYRLTRADGLITWVYAQAKEIEIEFKGRPLGYVGTITDITENKRAIDALKKSEASLAEAQRIANIGSWDLDLTTHELKWSDDIFRLFEIDPHKFAASYEGFLNVIHPDDRSFVHQAYTDSVKNKEPYDITHRLLMKNGGIKYVNERCETFYNSKGDPVRSVGTVQDITERKRAEEEHERLSIAIKHSTETIVIVDITGTIVYANPAFEHSTGYTLKETTGQTPRILKSGRHDETFYKNLWRTITGGKTWEGTLINKKKDGTIFEEQTSISPVFDANGEIINYVAVKHDVTARRNLERAKVFFTDTASHELRTPLTQLKLLQVLTGDLAEAAHDDETAVKSKELADEIYSSMDRIVTATSLYSALMAEVKVPFYPIVIKPLLEYQVDAIHHEAKKKGRNILIHMDLGGLPEGTAILGSQAMIEKALGEILSNAIKYTADERTVSVKGALTEGEVTMEIFNEGEGIPEDKIGMLFAPYYSLEDTLEHSTGKYKHKGGGLGLGLTITKMIAEYHGGGIVIKCDTEKKGTCVALRFPVSG